MTPKSLIEPARHAGTALLRSQTDARLVDLTRDGNERAFEAIVQRYRRPLLRYCSRLLPAARAEDAVQQAFLSAHRAIHAGDAELNLRPWLYRIAHNSSLNLLRQQGFDHEQVSEEIDGVDTPPQIFERGERLRTVVAAVQDLPDRQRDAIVLQAMEGRTYDEIAAELGVSEGAVRQLLNRARNTLRQAAAALTPTGLLSRVASSGGEAGVVERVAQVVTGAGGSALIAKAGATLVVAGAVAGGAATGTLPGATGHHRHSGGAPGASASAPRQAGVVGGSVAIAAAPGGHRVNVALTGNQRSGATSGGPGGGPAGGPGGGRGHGPSGQGGGGGLGSPGGRDHTGAGNGSTDHPGSGDGHHSGSSDHSGDGSGDSSTPSDHSGHGSGGDDHPSSDSGSSGPGGGPTPSPAPATSPPPPTSGRDRSGSGSPDEPPDPPEPPDDHSGKSH